MVKYHAVVTRMAIVQSPVYLEWIKWSYELPIAAVAAVPAMDSDSWTDEQHERVLSWASGKIPAEDVPAELLEYKRLVELQLA